MTTRNWHILPLLAAATTLVTGCEGEVEAPHENVQVALQRAQSCEDLESKLKDDAIAKMNRQIDAEIRYIEEGDHWGGTPGFGGEEFGASTGSGMGEPADGGGGGGNAAPPRHSETNTQVDGVDEADIVKTDGNHLYVLHGNQLAVLNAFPASELGIGSSTAVEGYPSEMFLTGDRVVVFSSVDGASVFQEAGVEPPTSESYHGDCWDCGGAYYPSLTKVTVMTLDGNVPSVERELYFEGWYQSSRRVGDKVRAVLNGGYHPPMVQYYPDVHDFWELSEDAKIAAFEQLRLTNLARIHAATLQDLLPHRFERVNGELSVLQPSCSDYYVPTAGSTEYGMTQIQSFDLADKTAGVAETQIVGQAQTVYANAGAMYLVGQSWNDPWLALPTWTELMSTTWSHVHKFDIEGHAPVYEGTGTIPGWVNNQFSLDEKDGKLRIATTDQRSSAEVWRTENNLYVLADAGTTLEVVGSVTGLAPDESIQSARFIGDMAYLVTFRQVDPLFAIDVSDPTAPRVLGELKIPGFSEYMHPLEGGTHLLTIGRDGTDDGQVLGVAISIFDVQNPLEPKLTHKLAIGDGHSEAELNHKAFTLYEGTLAIPMVRYDDTTYAASSTLELFQIDATTGITKTGSVDHSVLFEHPAPDSCYYYGYGVRRGVFIDNLVYSISEAGVLASDAQNPAQTVASLKLPALDMGCGGY